MARLDHRQLIQSRRAGGEQHGAQGAADALGLGEQGVDGVGVGQRLAAQRLGELAVAGVGRVERGARAVGRTPRDFAQAAAVPLAQFGERRDFGGGGRLVNGGRGRLGFAPRGVHLVLPREDLLAEAGDGEAVLGRGRLQCRLAPVERRRLLGERVARRLGLGLQGDQFVAEFAELRLTRRDGLGVGGALGGDRVA